MLAFLLPAPIRSRGDGATTRPDLDKLTRAVFDALTDAHIWHDDAQVVGLVATKRYAPPDKPLGVRIAIHPAGVLDRDLTLSTSDTGAGR